MSSDFTKTEKTEYMPRPPVVAVMGHINHGKSTLLDYIRKTKVAEQESGGITQHLGAYEVTVPQMNAGTDADKRRSDISAHPRSNQRESAIKSITFLDTPGHEAFCGIRERGAAAADIAILVVSGEEGVKPQTIEAFSFIKKAKIPYIVAITKTDKPTASVERAKQSLAEKEIFVEGYGGDIPCVPLSSKTGEGVGDLLDMIALIAELHGIRSATGAALKGFVVETGLEKNKGISATLVIKEGAIKTGDYAVAEGALSPVRRLENFAGETIDEATAGMPVRIIGWSELPRIGAKVTAAKSKQEAERLASDARGETSSQQKLGAQKTVSEVEKKAELCLIIKADASGSLEALEREIAQCSTDVVRIRIIGKGVGPIGENDLKLAGGSRESVFIGFNVSIDGAAKSIVERGGFKVGIFEVVYPLKEWLKRIVSERTPKILVEEMTGSARVLKVFTTEKDKQVIGGKVLDGEIAVGDEFKTLRRDSAIGAGKIRELQKFKEKINAAPKDSEFGAFVGSTVEIMPGDRIEAFRVVEK